MMDLEPVSSSAQVDSAADGTNKKIKRSHSPPQDDGPASVHQPTTPLIPPAPLTNQLGEDELSLIFRNSCITTGDLINLRLVGKSWRDAASSTLLRRNVLCIAHSKKKWSLCQQQKQQQQQRQERGDKTKGVLRGTLSKLTRLMSKSSKFPVSTFQLLFDSYFPRDDYFAPSTELKFFQLHGAKVKELCLLGSISLEPLLEFLSTYAPNIELLDLNQVHFLHLPPISQKEEGSDKFLNLIPVKTLEIGKCGDQFNAQALHLLLSSCSKLNSIKNVNRRTLPYILHEKKGQLIRYFEYTRPSHVSTQAEIEAYVSLMKQFSDVSPKLFSLKLDLDDYDYNVGFYIPIAAILESSKDTLQKLQLFILPIFDHDANKLKIFPMKNLKYICLDGPEKNLDEGETVSIWKDGMSAPEMFPSLNIIVLIDFNQENILEFFQFELETDEDGDETTATVKNPLPKVETLLMQGLCLPRNSESSLMSQFFPNLCRLEIECKNFQNFSNFLWPLFPSVEFLVLYNISWGGVNDEIEMSILTDLVFTGFAPELCAKLRHSDLPEFKNEAEGLNFLRITPSVCDMLHLKELTFMFVELWAKFASHVTGSYAFSQMPNTQFTIHYDPDKFSRNRGQYISVDIDHEELCFGSIKPYVKIVHIEQPDN